MSNPYKAPTSSVIPVDAMPSAYFKATELPDGGATFVEFHAGHKHIDFVQRKLQGLDMDLRPSFYVPKEWCVDGAVLSAKGEVLARTPGGQLNLRIRSGSGFKAGSAFYSQVRASDGPFATEAMRAKIENTFFADASPSWTLGRLQKAYPRVGSRIDAPVSRLEAAAAVERCGLNIESLPEHARSPFPLIPVGGDGQSVSVNMHSGNGLPVLGRMSTPGAAEKVLKLAAMVQAEISQVQGEGGVAKWKAAAEEQRPWLVSLLGKCKADYYSKEKIGAAMLRFYNVMPRPVMMVMQTVTQVLEGNSRGILMGFRSFSGVNLTRGGADQLVEKLDQFLEKEGRAYVHMGDDSWVVLRHGDFLVAFALDCSNFDITQHRDATAAVHLELRRQLRLIEPKAADLWYEYARSRQVVVARTLVRNFKHAGPSGMPLQSKVNDVLMEVLINRALEGNLEWADEGAVDAWLQLVGKRLGFVVKVEQHRAVRARSIREMLESRPFLFVGNYFYTSLGRVQVCADYPRMLAQMPYPGTTWTKSREDMVVREAMRLGSLVLSAGIPATSMREPFEALKRYALGLLEEAYRIVGDTEVKDLRWMIGESAWGPEAIPSIRGLSRALEDNERLWRDPDEELPSTSQLVSLTWADEIEEQEREERSVLGLPAVPRGAQVPRVPRGTVPPAPTHPASSRNDGRPPPTAVWGPNKEPRMRMEAIATLKRRNKRARGRRHQEILSGDDWSTDGEESN